MSQTRKILLRILLGIIVFVALVLSLALYMTKGIVHQANQFLLASQQQDFTKAYQMLTPEAQETVDESNFEDFLKSKKLNDYKSSLWLSRQIENKTGYLRGYIKTFDGTKVIVEIVLSKENGIWKIQRLSAK